MVADALKSSRACGASGLLVVVRADSAFYGRDVVAATVRAKARFSITARQDTAVKRAIAGIGEDAWTTIHYPHAVFDEQCSSGSATPKSPKCRSPPSPSRGENNAVTARLIVRRVRDRNPNHVVADEQGELFPAWRHHAVFTNSPLVMLQAEADHRRHAIVEQVIADLKRRSARARALRTVQRQRRLARAGRDGVRLTRAAGALASPFHPKATTATIRRQLINVPARPVRSARRLQLRLPTNWPWPTRGCTCSPPH